MSGGQTGADRAALDAASEFGIETGGWVPGGRRAEDGTIPERYSTLRETDTPDYAVRTELNVRDSDCTLIVSRGALEGGSLLTLQIAERLGKPALHIDLSESSVDDAARVFRSWLAANECAVLNVAGPRASSDPEIYGLVRRLLARALSDKA